ncbi:MAG TPA: acetyl-CoA carboxylase carboxyltransferase subunit alpha [Hyphomonadaceae bacterium]|nr:acetyl-CoA carboxylase carboxyltransferase subunit alpha [Hyphomonadaceae bacterium]HPI50528.1 acetyl-CoA carboxylase carboxyltransferase subunit alpha [Hyphomonadaceae bacterium]
MAVATYLDFEKPVADLEKRIAELEATGGATVEEEVGKLREKAEKQLEHIYTHLNAWQKTQVARHPERPHFMDYVDGLFEEFVELAGDRKFMNDDAIMGGLARFRGKPVVVIGHEKGRDTQTRLKHNFGMGKPEGYRKAVRLMELAGRFSLPVIALVDTSGAFPGKGGEERGQAEALARAIEACLTLDTPMISVIVGEGGSGGAVALASGNKVLMMEHAVYSVISPEGAASILFHDAKRAKDTAEAMKITAQDLEKFRIVDAIVTEPMGGAHRDPKEAIDKVGDAIEEALSTLSGLTPDDLRAQRKERFYAIGREGLA